MTNKTVRFIICLTNRCFERSWSYEEVVCINADDHYLYTGYNFLQDDTVYHYEQITVHTGDTMWAIADRWADQDEDVREVIYRICETNALANTNLKPGQKLLVPVRVQFVDQLMVAEAGDIKG
ncbi:MAG: LysM peptidoglycan-binding domain-containing protein [Phascolarctobacterium faecium]